MVGLFCLAYKNGGFSPFLSLPAQELESPCQSTYCNYHSFLKFWASLASSVNTTADSDLEVSSELCMTCSVPLTWGEMIPVLSPIKKPAMTQGASWSDLELCLGHKGNMIAFSSCHTWCVPFIGRVWDVIPAVWLSQRTVTCPFPLRPCWEQEE